MKSIPFDDPRDFFDLLGDASVAVLSELDSKPSPALVAHLHEKRASMQSIADLGTAAFAVERSNEEFQIYDRILNRDPKFGQVRAWVANQKGWNGMPQSRQATEMLQSLHDFPTLEILRTVPRLISA